MTKWGGKNEGHERKRIGRKTIAYERQMTNEREKKVQGGIDEEVKTSEHVETEKL